MVYAVAMAQSEHRDHKLLDIHQCRPSLGFRNQTSLGVCIPVLAFPCDACANPKKVSPAMRCCA